MNPQYFPPNSEHPPQSSSFTSWVEDPNSIFPPNGLDASIHESSAVAASVTENPSSTVAPTATSMPVQRHLSNTSLTPIVPPTANMVQGQQHGSNANIYRGNFPAVTTMAQQQAASTHAAHFNDPRIAQSATFLHQGLTSHTSNGLNVPLQYGCLGFVTAMKTRMHHPGLANRVAKFLDSFSPHPGDRTNLPADQAMCQLFNLGQRLGERESLLKRHFQQALRHIEQQNQQIQGLRSSNTNLTAALKAAVPKARSAQQVIKQHAGEDPIPTGYQNPHGYRTVAAAQQHLHATLTGQTTSFPSMLATPPPFDEPYQPQKRFVTPDVSPKSSTEAYSPATIDLTKTHGSVAPYHNGASLPNHPGQMSSSPATACVTPHSSSNSENPLVSNQAQSRPKMDWRSQPRWAPYPSAIPKSQTVQSWLSDPKIISQQQQQPAGQKRGHEQEPRGLVAPDTEPSRPVKKAKRTETAPKQSAPKKTPVKKAAPKYTEPRKRAPRKSKSEKALENAWTPELIALQNQLLNRQPSPPPAPPAPEARNATETIVIPDETAEDHAILGRYPDNAFNAQQTQDEAANAADTNETPDEGVRDDYNRNEHFQNAFDGQHTQDEATNAADANETPEEVTEEDRILDQHLADAIDAQYAQDEAAGAAGTVETPVKVFNDGFGLEETLFYQLSDFNEQHDWEG
ncbi:MAG: hypothetical protein L6R40_002684 [Gallowayella cf. fulva]|nr:MAG: hypothetical protein L6R40_002684 [Xanthomendoza cf. fulva]